MKRALLLSLLLGTWLCGCTDGAGLTENGGYCVFNEDCKSGFCDENDVCRARDGSGGTIVNGQACTKNEECVSNNCYEGKVCRTPNWGGGGLAVGDVCSLDSQCASKSCKSGYCAGTKTVNGEACTKNEDCESGNCYEGKVCRIPNWVVKPRLKSGAPARQTTIARAGTVFRTSAILPV